LLVCAGCNAAETQAPAASPSAAPPPASSVANAPPPTAAAEPAPSAPAAPATELPKTPPELQVPPNSALVLKAHGKGVQIYECAAKPDDAKSLAWKLKAPEADLFDDAGQKVAKHFAGPTWQASDGSSVLGSVMAKADAPDPQAIPWLLLTSVGKGPGVFASVMHIQRVDTSGGKAPDVGCDKAHAKAEVRVPYEANYYFYSLTPGSK
ncbi:MAG TPA: DUF3455 domain-containing protein, partial [Polyangiaceae bacterium]|nr:DUF3455 domain-containing protein [Polyangiaceae bacterium]